MAYGQIKQWMILSSSVFITNNNMDDNTTVTEFIHGCSSSPGLNRAAMPRCTCSRVAWKMWLLRCKCLLRTWQRATCCFKFKPEWNDSDAFWVHWSFTRRRFKARPLLVLTLRIPHELANPLSSSTRPIQPPCIPPRAHQQSIHDLQVCNYVWM